MTSSVPTDNRRTLRTRRLATTSVFFVNGMALALWFSSVPVLSAQMALSEARLGTALGAQGLGTVIFVVVGSLIATKYGTRATMLAGAVLFLLALQYIGLGMTAAFLVPAIFALGATNSFVDVSMNAHASLVERDYRKEIMPSFHAAYNFGGFAGASITALLITLTEGYYWPLSVAGIAMVGVIALGWALLGDLRPDEHVIPTPQLATGADDRLNARSVFKNGPLFILGFFVVLALFVENGMNGWSGIYLTDVVSAQPQVAAMAFGAFQLSMAIGRLLGGPAIRLLGAGKTLTFGALLGAFGVLLAVMWVSTATAIIGFALIGIGLSNLVPMFFTRAAAAIPKAPAVGIATVNTIGYLGYISGPLALGLIAEATDLKTAFLFILGALAIIAVGARLVVHIRSSAEFGLETGSSSVVGDTLKNEKF